MPDHSAGFFFSKDGKSFHARRSSRESVLRMLETFSPGIVLWSVQGGDICRRLGLPEPPVLPEAQAKQELEKLFGSDLFEVRRHGPS